MSNQKNTSLNNNPIKKYTKDLPSFLKRVKMSLEPLRLGFEQFDRVEEQIIASELTSTLHREDEVIAESAEFDFVLELLVSQAFSADGVFHRVLDNSFGLACRGVFLELNDATRETTAEFLGVVSENWFLDLNTGE